MKLKSNNPSGLLTNSDLDKIAELMDQRVAPLATKVELSAMEKRLKTHMNQGIESVMGGMDALHDELAGKNSRSWITRQ